MILSYELLRGWPNMLNQLTKVNQTRYRDFPGSDSPRPVGRRKGHDALAYVGRSEGRLVRGTRHGQGPTPPLQLSLIAYYE
jgi:hypothetical protein